jgi:hypothetical protein
MCGTELCVADASHTDSGRSRRRKTKDRQKGKQSHVLTDSLEDEGNRLLSYFSPFLFALIRTFDLSLPFLFPHRPLHSRTRFVLKTSARATTRSGRNAAHHPARDVRTLPRFRACARTPLTNPKRCKRTGESCVRAAHHQGGEESRIAALFRPLLAFLHLVSSQ